MFRTSWIHPTAVCAYLPIFYKLPLFQTVIPTMLNFNFIQGLLQEGVYLFALSPFPTA